MSETYGLGSNKTGRCVSTVCVVILLGAAALHLCGLSCNAAERTQSAKTSQPPSSEYSPVPSGTILPAILRTTISPGKTKQGQIIRAEIAQDVPLPGGARIRKGSKMEGTVVEVAPIGNELGSRVSVRFDKLHSRNQVLGISLDLRAIAGFMEVMDAAIPDQGMGEGDAFDWMDTTQIGGDSVFGRGGPVTSAHNATDSVGKAPMSGGVLVQVRPNGKCRGALGDDRPQALWVFSSDACGIYGLSNVTIAHAGRTEPIGTVALDLRTRKTDIRAGAGLLLRVIQ